MLLSELVLGRGNKAGHTAELEQKRTIVFFIMGTAGQKKREATME